MAHGEPLAQPPLRASDAADQEQLRLAQMQGDAFQQAVDRLMNHAAHGAERRVGEYLIGYAVESAEGMYRVRDGQLEWQEPRHEHAHINIVVRDGTDGRFLPGLTVYATLIDDNGATIGCHQQPFVWHPWLYHYGRNWRVPGAGAYTLRVRVEMPDFSRHDKVYGRRFAQPVEVAFRSIWIETEQKQRT